MNPLDIKVGSIIKFGNYFQNHIDTKEPIEWLVLENDGETALLISRFALDSKAYNDAPAAVTWDTCALRRWLNGEFISDSFTPEEQAQLALTAVGAGGNPQYKTVPGKEVKDRVFILSIAETLKYFESDEEKLCVPTVYAKSCGAHISNSFMVDGRASGVWWLRSPGSGNDRAAAAGCENYHLYDGVSVVNPLVSVRPALRLDLKAVSFAAQKINAHGQAASEAKKPAAGFKKLRLTGFNPVKGSYVKFGSYFQQHIDIKEPIEWLVLENDGKTALLLSRYALDSKPFNETDADVAWSSCALRRWLNGEFIHDSFSAEEQQVMASTSVAAAKNPQYDTLPGKPTRDKVFILSLPELEKYLVSDDVRLCIPTVYAKNCGAFIYNEYRTEGRATCPWWVRAPGEVQSKASVSSGDGSHLFDGIKVSNPLISVRPALRLDLSLIDSGLSQEELSAAFSLQPENTAADETGRPTAGERQASPGTKLRSGEFALFGRYYNESSEEKSPIEWLVLENDGETALLISRYALDCIRFNERRRPVMWKECTVRKWLNAEFITVAFTKDEQADIFASVISPDNVREGESDGTVKDKIFLLSINEAEGYFNSDEERKCTLTAYAKAKQNCNDYDSAVWWLRSPGVNRLKAAGVDTSGSIYYYGRDIFETAGGVRPVIRAAAAALTPAAAQQPESGGGADLQGDKKPSM